MNILIFNMFMFYITYSDLKDRIIKNKVLFFIIIYRFIEIILLNFNFINSRIFNLNILEIYNFDRLNINLYFSIMFAILITLICLKIFPNKIGCGDLKLIIVLSLLFDIDRLLSLLIRATLLIICFHVVKRIFYSLVLKKKLSDSYPFAPFLYLSYLSWGVV